MEARSTAFVTIARHDLGMITAAARGWLDATEDLVALRSRPQLDAAVTRAERIIGDLPYREDEPDEPTDEQLANRPGMEGGIAYPLDTDTRDEHDPTLG